MNEWGTRKVWKKHHHSYHSLEIRIHNYRIVFSSFHVRYAFLDLQAGKVLKTHITPNHMNQIIWFNILFWFGNMILYVFFALVRSDCLDSGESYLLPTCIWTIVSDAKYAQTSQILYVLWRTTSMQSFIKIWLTFKLSWFFMRFLQR